MRFTLRTGLILPAILLSALATSGVLRAAPAPDVMPDLEAGKLADAEQKLATHLAGGADDRARFQLGFVQFLQGIEGLSQSSYKYGLEPRLRMLPMLRMRVESNPRPEVVRYQDVRDMLENFRQSLERAEATLAPVKATDLAWKVDLLRVRFDANGDGTAAPEETLGLLMLQFANPGGGGEIPPAVTLGLDSADVYWLRGYCKLLGSLADMMLAHDAQRLFDHTAQLLFPQPETPFPMLRELQLEEPWADFPDYIAFVHLIDFPVKEPERLKRAHANLLEVIALSRENWKLIQAETDDDAEWIPSPKQHSITGVEINRDRVVDWHKFLDEGEAILKGEKLVPFWRAGKRPLGINLSKVFLEPRDFDLVLWAQGTAAQPYLEEGQITSPDTWRQVQQTFQGNFLGFAAWIN